MGTGVDLVVDCSLPLEGLKSKRCHTTQQPIVSIDASYSVSSLLCSLSARRWCCIVGDAALGDMSVWRIPSSLCRGLCCV
jgi:hypothetical protein